MSKLYLKNNAKNLKLTVSSWIWLSNVFLTRSTERRCCCSWRSSSDIRPAWKSQGKSLISSQKKDKSSFLKLINNLHQKQPSWHARQQPLLQQEPHQVQHASVRFQSRAFYGRWREQSFGQTSCWRGRWLPKVRFQLVCLKCYIFTIFKTPW